MFSIESLSLMNVFCCVTIRNYIVYFGVCKQFIFIASIFVRAVNSFYHIQMQWLTFFTVFTYVRIQSVRYLNAICVRPQWVRVDIYTRKQPKCG